MSSKKHRKKDKKKKKDKVKETRQSLEELLLSDPVQEERKVAPEPPKKMTTIVDTMQFLQEAYDDFLKKTEAEQARVLQENVKTLATIVQSSKLSTKKTLRELYIDLMLHDENIRNASSALDQWEKYPDLNRDKIVEHQTLLRGLLKNKFFIHMLIRVHEMSGEVIVPEPTVLHMVQETQGDPDQLKEGIMQWVAPNKQKVFRQRIETEWTQNQGSTEWIQNMLKACFEHGIILGFRTLEDSQKLINIADSFSLFDRLWLNSPT